jgi:hypothetical protein
MLVEFPARGFHRLILATTSRRRSHDLFHANCGRLAVVGCHTATYVALGDDADQLEVLCILNDW